MQPNRLRPVGRAPAADAAAGGKTGMLFACVNRTCCVHCGAVVPTGDAHPLTLFPCPACGKRVLAPGRLGGFLLYAPIGEGEMGTLFRATDESLKRDVAIKLVRLSRADDPQLIERLRAEACAAGKVNHPRVAQVYALNFSNGHPYLVMELVAGEDLAQRMARAGALDERAVLRIALDVAAGLSALNREGLVHGDIKPSNIVLDRDGNAKLVDLGLSGMSRRDSEGRLIGTPDYIPPELLQGGRDTHSGDLYSFGATLYHLLAGRPPFEGETPADIIRARLTSRPQPLVTAAPGTSYATCTLVMRLMETEPAARPADSDAAAAEIRRALDLLDHPLTRRPGALRRAGAFLRARAPTLRLPRRAVAAAVIVLIGAAAAALLILAASRDAPPRAPFLSALWQRVGDAMEEITAKAVEAKAGLSPSRSPGAAPGAPAAAPVAVSDLPPPRADRAAAPAAPPFVRNLSPALWESADLGGEAKGGGMLQTSDALILQGTGEEMWRGYDRCRFAWIEVVGDYELSVKVVAIADTHAQAMAGLLLKGRDLAQPEGVFFGFLGNGELVLQRRLPGNKTKVVRRSGVPVRRPAWLAIRRVGGTFEASVSANGVSWKPFTACLLDLPVRNSVGFAVSANSKETPGTAKFADIRVRAPGQ